jgi:Clp protease
MAYSMGSVVLQAASEGRRFAFPHSWIMIHEPAKWAGWQSTSAAAQHLERLKQMQDQIYKILSVRSGKPLRQIIRDTKRTDFYLDAQNALDYGLIDAVVAGELPEPKPLTVELKEVPAPIAEVPAPVPPLEAPAAAAAVEAEAAQEWTNGGRVRLAGSAGAPGTPAAAAKAGSR